MDDLSNLFDEDTVEAISNLVEEKMSLLNNISAFKEKDQALATATEELENALSKELNDKLDKVMKLHYQIDSYYFTLAYFLGKQHGEQIQKLWLEKGGKRDGSLFQKQNSSLFYPFKIKNYFYLLITIVSFALDNLYSGILNPFIVNISIKIIINYIKLKIIFILIL